MGEWNYIFLKPAERYLERLNPSDQRRIINALESLILAPELCDIKPLKGRLDWRLRVGNFRVLFLINTENKVFIITRISPKSDIYRK